jgi:arsenate reductase (thioredoxin)
MTLPTKVLFVCIGNSCRSQMAEALARHSAHDLMEVASAGISPLGFIAGPTREVLSERGVASDGQSSKGLGEIIRFQPDLIINMSGYPGQGRFGDYDFEDWDVEDPYGDELATYRRICDDIEARMADLVARLRAKTSPDAPE